MRLFFETDGQGISFLAAIPLGFLLAVCLDCAKGRMVLRAVLDVIVLMICGFILLLLTVFLSEEMLRIYHLLGLATGGVLYLRGTWRIKRSMILTARKRKKLKTEGILNAQNE